MLLPLILLLLQEIRWTVLKLECNTVDVDLSVNVEAQWINIQVLSIAFPLPIILGLHVDVLSLASCQTFTLIMQLVLLKSLINLLLLLKLLIYNLGVQ